MAMTSRNIRIDDETWDRIERARDLWVVESKASTDTRTDTRPNLGLLVSALLEVGLDHLDDARDVVGNAAPMKDRGAVRKGLSNG